MSTLPDLLSASLDARAAWLADLDDTDCWRLFHGAVEGRPGLTIDRYGPVLLIQSFRELLEPGDLDAVKAFAAAHLPDIQHVVWNHRGRDKVEQQHISDEAAAEHIVVEHGLRFAFQARHRGNDPWLFLDMRSGRRRVRAEAAGKRVLNLFAYTCGVGVTAAAGGAKKSVNIDFSTGALGVGQRNAALNDVPERQFRSDRADVIATIRQMAGQRIRGKAAHRKFKRYGKTEFDLIVLDPPTWAKSPFGAVDPVRDYASLFKPCLQIAAPGAAILATNHVSAVDRDAWVAGLRRCAEKAECRLSRLISSRPTPTSQARTAGRR